MAKIDRAKAAKSALRRMSEAIDERKSDDALGAAMEASYHIDRAHASAAARKGWATRRRNARKGRK